jgi:protein TonB
MMEEIMNIQRYTLPVVIAAGFHGALFLGLSDSTHGNIKMVEPRPTILKAFPPDDPVQLPADNESGPSDTSPSRSPAVPDLPEVIAPSNKSDFVTPVVDHPRADKPVSILSNVIGEAEGPSTGPWTGLRGGPIDFNKLDRAPRATAQMSPDFPSTMRQQGIAGSVTVAFEVDKEGRVVRAEALNYTRREFVEPALRAVRNWHFEPGKQNGRPVSFRMAVPIEFLLDSN